MGCRQAGQPQPRMTRGFVLTAFQKSSQRFCLPMASHGLRLIFALPSYASRHQASLADRQSKNLSNLENAASALSRPSVIFGKNYCALLIVTRRHCGQCRHKLGNRQINFIAMNGQWWQQPKRIISRWYCQQMVITKPVHKRG